jgi:excisionase family DNA binding protein
MTLHKPPTTQPLSTAEVAARAGSCTRFVTEAITSGRLPAWRLGAKSYRVAEADADAWISSLRVTPRIDAVGAALDAMSKE